MTINSATSVLWVVERQVCGEPVQTALPISGESDDISFEEEIREDACHY